MASRAVHLDVASSLTTDSCVNCLRRFIARRGKPKVIWSDNGTNLIGCEKEMHQEIDKWNQAEIHKDLAQKNIVLTFNPPYGSHHGGVWERLIRSIQKVLNGIVSQQTHTLDDDSLVTLLCEVEAILNARPITSSLDSLSDLPPLTPNHLLRLHGGDVTTPALFSKCDNYVKQRWRYVQYLTDVFWHRWVKEYLPMLQARQKWIQKKRNVAVGDIVLLTDSAPRNSWKMGKIMEVYSDKKGLVQSAKGHTSLSELVRSIDKLCMLLEAEECISVTIIQEK
ncbi:uncharacterized protein [Haliotis asinina]|uniref:uncharacterized protein n=1 Tax=Haliotis asinina TaxID=109174 RepID=UPI003531F8F6